MGDAAGDVEAARKEDLSVAAAAAAAAAAPSREAARAEAALWREEGELRSGVDFPAEEEVEEEEAPSFLSEEELLEPEVEGTSFFSIGGIIGFDPDSGFPIEEQVCAKSAKGDFLASNSISPKLSIRCILTARGKVKSDLFFNFFVL